MNLIASHKTAFNSWTAIDRVLRVVLMNEEIAARRNIDLIPEGTVDGKRVKLGIITGDRNAAICAIFQPRMPQFGTYAIDKTTVWSEEAMKDVPSFAFRKLPLADVNVHMGVFYDVVPGRRLIVRNKETIQ